MSDVVRLRLAEIPIRHCEAQHASEVSHVGTTPLCELGEGDVAVEGNVTGDFEAGDGAEDEGVDVLDYISSNLVC